MKIGIIGTRGIPARYGGFETAAEELAKGFARRGHRVYVACRRYLYPEMLKERGRFFPLKRKWEENLFLIFPPSIPGKATDTFSHTLFSLLYLLFFYPVGVIVVFNVANAPLVFLLQLLRKRVVLNTDGLEWKRKKWGPFARVYLRSCELLACFSGATLISDSRAIAAYYRRKYGKETVFIPYGAHVKEEALFTQKEQDRVLEGYGLERDGYLLVVARLEPENNTDLVIRAFRTIETEKRLVIVGGTNWRSPYVERLKECSGEGVQFLGPVYEPGHLEVLFANCYLYIHGHEVGGTNPVLLQAMAAGCCVLALGVVFNAEVIDGAGILFDKEIEALAEKLRYCLANPEVVRYYRKVAPERIRKFYNWEMVIAEYEKVCLKIRHKDNKNRR